MIKYLIAFILFASPCLAGMGIGGFPYPGPGVVVASGGGSCSTQSVLLDNSGTRAGNSTELDSSSKWNGFRFVGNGKPLHSITLKTGSAAQGSSATYTVNVNTSSNFSGTHADSFTVSTPGAADTEFTATSTGNPVMLNGTTYYVAIGSASATWGTRLGLQYISDAGGDNMGSTLTGLSNFVMCTDCNISTWAKVNVCD